MGAIAISVDPSGTAAATLGIDTALQIKDWLAPKPDIAKLSKALNKAFHNTLKSEHYAIPADARRVLPQMLEDAFPTGEQIAESGLQADHILAEMHKELGRLDSKAKRDDYQRNDIVPKFNDLVLPLLTQACNDPDLVAALQPALVRAQAKANKTVAEGNARTQATLEKLVEQTQQNPNLSPAARELARQEKLIREIARRHLESQPDDPLDALNNIAEALESYAADKAKGSNFGADFDDVLKHIDDLLIRNGDVADAQRAFKQAKQDAADKANAIKAHQMRLRDKELNLAKLANDPQTAASLEIDRLRSDQKPNVPVGEIVQLAMQKEARYKRFGNSFDATTALALLQTALDQAQPEDRPDAILGQLANATLSLGKNQSSPDTLAQAVALYQQHEKEVPKSLLPKAWATAQNNLGIALQDQGIRADGEAGADLLA